MSTIPVIWEAEDFGSRPALAKSYQDPVSTNKPCMMVHNLNNPSYAGSVGRKIVIWAGLGNVARPYLKYTE
jgi:hypothetical protein